MPISYGSLNFPTPLPVVAIGDEPLYVAGEIDSSVTKISLIGTITGQNLASLSTAKKQIISGLLSEYQTLDIEGEAFTYCRPVSVNFSDSDLTTILPYSIEFERYDEKDFSAYYGVVNPVNTWSYQEQQGRIVQATHTVAAQGKKTSATDALEAAKNFVDAQLNGFENLSVFHDAVSGFLISKTEEIDRFANSYSVTENYSFSTSENPINNSGIISANTQINYAKDGNSSVSVNGSILGGFASTPVNTGMFTPTDAKNLALLAIQNSKSDYEDTIYGILQADPYTYNYDVNEQENKINFSFQFKDPFDATYDGVVHDYSISINCSKDGNVTSASIEGTLTYDSCFDLFNGGPIESHPRYLKILDVFNSLDLYGLLLGAYNEFREVVADYDCATYLNSTPESESVTKNPFIPNISYSYTYTNKIDYSNGQLKDLTIQINDSPPINKGTLKESNGGFVSSTYKTLGKIQVSVSSNDDASKIDILKGIAESFITDKCTKSEDTETIGSDNISYSVSYYYTL